MRTFVYYAIALVLLLTSSCKKDDAVLQQSIANEVISGKSGSGTGNGKKTGIVKDIDGNTYTTVQIGNQIWMSENLRVSKFRNGDPIVNVTNSSDWQSASYGAAWCYWDNASHLDLIYGKLYNWISVIDTRGLAPRGWHIPTYDEVQVMINFLGGNTVAGGSLKENSVYWESPNIGATNSAGFNGRPAGFRYYNGIFIGLNQSANFWTSTPYNSYLSMKYLLASDNTSVGFTQALNNEGASIRCIKD